MDTIDYQDFVFESDEHVYRTASGIVRPSITQMLSRVGVYDFSMVPPAILENARRRGTNVHKFCAEYDVHGWIDEAWIAADEMPYVEAWVKFRHDSNIVISKVETPVMRHVAGVLIAGTPDVVGFIGATPFVVERKACRAKHPGWAIQTAMQEMLETGKSRVGHMGRMSVQLLPTGNYSTSVYEDQSDGDIACAIIQKTGCEESIATWAKNNGLKLAA